MAALINDNLLSLY